MTLFRVLSCCSAVELVIWGEAYSRSFYSRMTLTMLVWVHSPLVSDILLTKVVVWDNTPSSSSELIIKKIIKKHNETRKLFVLEQLDNCRLFCGFLWKHSLHNKNRVLLMIIIPLCCSKHLQRAYQENPPKDGRIQRASNETSKMELKHTKWSNSNKKYKSMVLLNQLHKICLKKLLNLQVLEF